MCLAVPGEILSLDADGPLRMGVVQFGGVTREVCLAYVPEAEVGAFVLVHVGFAIATIDADEAARVFRYLDEIAAIEAIDEATTT